MPIAMSRRMRLRPLVGPLSMLLCVPRQLATPELSKGLAAAGASLSVRVASNSVWALTRAADLPPDVALVSQGFVANPTAFCTELRRRCPETTVVFVAPGGPGDLILPAICRGFAGLNESRADPRRWPPWMTNRQWDVLVGIARGMSNTEIASELGVSVDTIKTHCRRLFQHLGARDRAHAVTLSFHTGLLRSGSTMGNGTVRTIG